MAQQDALDALKKAGGRAKMGRLVEITGLTRNSLRQSLRACIGRGEVEEYCRGGYTLIGFTEP